MRARATISTVNEPLFDHDVGPRPPDGVRELLFADDNEFGRGDRWFLLMGGVTLTRRRHTILRDFELLNERDAPAVTMRFCLEGDVQARMESLGGEVVTETGTHTLLYTPERAFKHVLHRDSTHDVIEAYLTQDYVTALAERYPEYMDSYFSPILKQEPFRLHGSGLRILPKMQSALRQILDSREHGPLRRLFVEAKVIELLALQLGQVERNAGLSVRNTELSRREVDRMVEARAFLLSRFDDPPTLAELAAAVGTNEFALKRGFKAVFGTTAFGLLLDYKMAQGHALLVDTDRPISAIAHELGYRHQAHFSTAFKKKYGVPPSTLRRR